MAFDPYQHRRSGGQGTGDIVTAITHDHASRQGGTYVVAFGPIIVGVIRLFRGLASAGS